MKKIVVILFIAVSLDIVAQVDKGFDSQNNFNQYVSSGAGSSTVVRQIKPMSQGVEGHPYYSEKFLRGKIQVNGQSFYPVDINLDLIENELLVMRDRKSPLMVIEKGTVDFFTFEFYTDSVINFKKIYFREAYLFAQLVAQNTSTEIYLNRIKRIRKADNSGPYARGTNFDQIYEEFEYLWKDLASNEIKEVNTKKKLLPSLFPGEESKAEKFLKSSSADVKRMQGLNSFFSHMVGPLQ